MSRELLEDQIYRHLRGQLADGLLAVGAHLKAGEIATDLDVSRTSVRKAILRLAEDGCVELSPTGRPRVVSLPWSQGPANEAPFVFINQTEQAYWTVFRNIFQGLLREGEFVNGQELADASNVSLGTIRQALDWLCRDGLLQRLPRRGWKVVQLDLRDIADAFKIRLLLETEAIGRAVHQLTRPQLERLIAENERVLLPETPLAEDERRQIDYRFHHTILVASGSPILLQLVDPLVRKCMLTGVSVDVPSDVVPVTYSEHVEIARALLDQDLPRAQSILKTHLLRSLEMYEQLRADHLGGAVAASGDHPG